MSGTKREEKRKEKRQTHWYIMYFSLGFAGSCFRFLDFVPFTPLQTSFKKKKKTRYDVDEAFNFSSATRQQIVKVK